MSMPSQARAIADVVRYFVEHPESADSVEGIVRWRLLERRLHETMQETAVAVEWLVGRSLLQEIDTPGGRKLYRLPADRVGDAERLLTEGRS
jgi:uncharacterized membrane protein